MIAGHTAGPTITPLCSRRPAIRPEDQGDLAGMSPGLPTTVAPECPPAGRQRPQQLGPRQEPLGKLTDHHASDSTTSPDPARRRTRARIRHEESKQQHSVPFFAYPTEFSSRTRWLPSQPGVGTTISPSPVDRCVSPTTNHVHTLAASSASKNCSDPSAGGSTGPRDTRSPRPAHHHADPPASAHTPGRRLPEYADRSLSTYSSATDHPSESASLRDSSNCLATPEPEPSTSLLIRGGKLQHRGQLEVRPGNLILLCGPHHRGFEQPAGNAPSQPSSHWTPPPWIDPARTAGLNQRIRHRQ